MPDSRNAPTSHHARRSGSAPPSAPRSIPNTGQQLAAFMSIPTLLALLMLATVQPAPAADPVIVSASWQGPAEPVFDSETDGCDRMDIPDQSARAFRDADGQVHLFATHYIARAMVGPSLDTVRHDCHVVYRSVEDADPSHFQDRNWLGSFYTDDGRRIVALLHSEYEAWTHPGMCATPGAGWPMLANCWWNSVTMAVSQDGGSSFTAPTPPANLVASLPYVYDKANTVGAVGYNGPTNIIRIGPFYFAMIGDWPYKAQKYGPCLIRTTDPFDAASWRAWDGADFTIRFANPYVERGFRPEEHICTPVGVQEVYEPGSLSAYGAGGTYLTVQFTRDTRFGTPGLYISDSSDLIHWSKPSLVASAEQMRQQEPSGKWRYDYPALLDPTAPDRNFATVAEAPFVYYVRFDLVRGNLSRTLMRRPINIHLGSWRARSSLG
jgi:hypothetical protein